MGNARGARLELKCVRHALNLGDNRAIPVFVPNLAWDRFKVTSAERAVLESLLKDDQERLRKRGVNYRCRAATGGAACRYLGLRTSSFYLPIGRHSFSSVGVMTAVCESRNARCAEKRKARGAEARSDGRRMAPYGGSEFTNRKPRENYWIIPSPSAIANSS